MARFFRGSDDSSSSSDLSSDSAEYVSPSPIGLHITVDQHCGLCGFRFDSGDKITALINVVAWGKCISFDASDYTFRDSFWVLGGWTLCRRVGCTKCRENPESTVVHRDCYSLFMQQAKSPRRRERLCILASRSHRPWIGRGEIKLPPDFMTETANSLAAQVHGLERLAAVPPEIALMVWKFVEKSPLYRFAAVLNKVDFFDDATGDGIASMPLTRIERWDRGGDLLERTGHEDVNQLITVDSRGIRSIEEFRLSDMRTRKRDEATLYAVHQSRQNINFDTKLGQGLLEDFENERLVFTDIPFNTGDLDCLPPPDEFPRRIQTIQLSTCTGLTLFTFGKEIISIHAHTTTEPSAELTFNKLNSVERAFVAWTYAPLSRTDSIEAFGIGYRVKDGKQVSGVWNFFIRTKLTGEYSVGPQRASRDWNTVAFLVSQDSVFAHSLTQGDAACILGMYPKEQRLRWSGPEIPLPTEGFVLAYEDDPYNSEDDVNYSKITLTEVECVWIFRYPDSSILGGLVVEFKNGGQRGLGTCRPGYMTKKRCSDLGLLAFLNVREYLGPFLKDTSVLAEVFPSLDALGEASKDGWLGCREGCVVESWYYDRQMSVSVR